MEELESEKHKAQDRLIWLDDHVKLMLSLYAQARPLLGKTEEYKNKITMWHSISAIMREHGCNFTGEQVSNKWKSLKRLTKQRKIKNIIVNKNGSTRKLFCRVCQTWRDCEIDLMDRPKSRYNVDTYLDCYNYVLNSNIYLKADDSHKLCRKCSKKLLIAYEFTLKANKVEQLKTDIKNMELLVDPLQCELNFEDIFGLKQAYEEDIEKVEEKEIQYKEQEVIEDDEEMVEEKKEEEETVCSVMLWNEEEKESAKEFFNCLACENTFFESLEEYLVHYQLEHETKEYVCEKHNSPEVEKIFQCEDCERSYKTKNSYSNHRRRHLGKTVPCEICKKEFICKKERDRHLRFHTKDFPYVCEYCGKTFALSSHLKDHEMRHKNLRCECPICGKQFLVARSLYQHYSKHTGEMPYPCCHCERAYPTLTRYKVHLRDTHKIDPTEEEILKSQIKCNFKTLARPKIKWVQVREMNGEESPQTENDIDKNLI